MTPPEGDRLASGGITGVVAEVALAEAALGGAGGGCFWRRSGDGDRVGAGCAVAAGGVREPPTKAWVPDGCGNASSVGGGALGGGLALGTCPSCSAGLTVTDSM